MPVLVEGLRSDEESDRVVAAIACTALGPLAAPAVPALIEVLKIGGNDSNVFACNHAVIALQAIGPGAIAAVPTLIEMLGVVIPDTNANVIIDATNAATALGIIGPAARDAIPALRRCLDLDDSDDLIRWLRLEAAEAIWRIDGDVETPLKLATKLLGDDDKWVRAEAAELLGKLGTSALPAVADLRRLLEDEDDDQDAEYIRQKVRTALAAITD